MSNVTQRTDARNVVTNYSYDALDRPTARSYPASTSETVTYGYDATASGNEGVGRLTSITDQSGSTALVHDLRGNLIQETRTIGSVAYTTAYAYDLADRVSSVTYPSGRIVTYTRGHDQDYRLSAIATTDGLTAVQDLAYGYDAADGVSSITDSLASARSQTFGYDNRRRLTDAMGYGSFAATLPTHSWWISRSARALPDWRQHRRQRSSLRLPSP